MNPAAMGVRGDHDLRGLNTTGKDRGWAVPNQKLREAAVLVPIVDRPEGQTVLLTKRTEHLPKHAGQVAFPGGRVEPQDEDIVDTALRETEEEIGLGRSFIEVCGFLDRYHTGTGFDVVPVVGLVKPGFSLVLQETEVESAFEVPLPFILDRSNHTLKSALWQGVERHYYTMPYEGYYIWGATAAMLVNLCDVMEAAQEETA